MNLNEKKLNAVFHEILSIISDLAAMDKNCKGRNCRYAREKGHERLLKCQKLTLKLRQDLLDAIEED